MNSTTFHFKGIHYMLADNWFSVINLNDYKNRPIYYLEIGTFFGANLLSVEKTYAQHPDSKLYCIDPWEDYEEYHEYKGQQLNIYDTFIENIEKSEKKNKIIINRGYSNVEIPKFQDAFFDIIYIDGNHNAEYVLEDAVLSFRKLKIGGIMIFDDYIWETAKIGINGFLSSYMKKLEFFIKENQVFVRKLH